MESISYKSHKYNFGKETKPPVSFISLHFYLNCKRKSLCIAVYLVTGINIFTVCVIYSVFCNWLCFVFLKHICVFGSVVLLLSVSVIKLQCTKLSFYLFKYLTVYCD